MNQISAAALKQRLSEPGELAFLDIREHGQYGEGHPFFSVHMPFSIIEERAPLLVPRQSTECILLDDGDGVAERAAMVMARIGYTNLHVLTGGAPAWAAAGYTLYKGVNVPSKTFGELVEHELQVRSVSAEDLKKMQDEGKPLAIFDGRGPSEFHKMSIPGAKSCPNAELGYRMNELVQDDTTTIVINCAGRTRSIIGASGLSLLDLPNPVYALKNGTQGWRLAGFDLMHGLAPALLPVPGAAGIARASARAVALISRYGLERASLDQVNAWQADSERTTYLFDVRTVEEYEAAHFANAVHAPGGQLVQATDEKMAVRGARVVLCCDTGLRAATTALWLRGMGHEVYVLNEDGSTGTVSGLGVTKHADPHALTLNELAGALAAGRPVLDASRSTDYRKSHIKGVRWVTRARLDLTALSGKGAVLVTGRNAALIAGVVADLRDAGVECAATVPGGPASWASAGLQLEATQELPAESDCIDFLFFVHDRHDGNLDAARRYLAWELGLVEQLDEQERAVLKAPRPVTEAS